MQPSAIMFHWTACIGFVQSLFLAVVNPPTLMRAMYTGTALVNVYYYGLSAQLHEPSRQTMRLYVPDDEQCMLRLSRAAKWASRGLHVASVAMDVLYIVVVTDYDIWLTMMMFIACGFYPAMKLLRWCAPEINTAVARRLQHTNGNNSTNGNNRNYGQYGNNNNNNNETRTPVHAEYSLLDDTDHRNTVQQRFMMKQVPRMLAMIALSACHMALMLDVRASCASMEMNAAANSSAIFSWVCD
jgi:hypothetical protein